jgi:hypothetical protein
VPLPQLGGDPQIRIRPKFLSRRFQLAIESAWPAHVLRNTTTVL